MKYSATSGCREIEQEIEDKETGTLSRVLIWNTKQNYDKQDKIYNSIAQRKKYNVGKVVTTMNLQKCKEIKAEAKY